jgi:hypothetical protein
MSNHLAIIRGLKHSTEFGVASVTGVGISALISSTPAAPAARSHEPIIRSFTPPGRIDVERFEAYSLALHSQRRYGGRS